MTGVVSGRSGRRRVARRTKNGPNVWVVRYGAGFSVTEEGTGIYLVPPIGQRSAVAIARSVARANRSELIVQARSGRIRFRDSHGADSRARRG